MDQAVNKDLDAMVSANLGQIFYSRFYRVILDESNVIKSDKSISERLPSKALGTPTLTPM